MFESVPAFGIGHFGLFWDRIREEFPSCVSQPAITNVVETFGSPKAMSVELFQGAPPTRALYQSRTSGELIQVQADRFSFNWKLVSGAEYPRYDATLPRFWALFDLFAEFLRQKKLGPIALTQCEVTNVNIIPVAEFGGTFGQAASALAVHVPTLEEYPELALENAQVAARYLMSDEDGVPFGRVHASAHSVFNIATAEAAIRLDLTARGGKPSLDRQSAQEFFECSRNAINAAFLAYTSVKAHAHWGKR
jgi:uncharacterized protein (TIGR04255 family)